MMDFEFLPQEIDRFKKSENENLTAPLEEFLRHVANSGDPVCEWCMIKPVYRAKIISVLKTYSEEGPIGEINITEMTEDILDKLDRLQNTPSTIQRISELLTTPRKEYSRMDKFMRGLRKNLVQRNNEAYETLDNIENEATLDGGPSSLSC